MSQPTNTALLHARKDLLTALESQRRYVLQRMTEATACPACCATITFASASLAFLGKDPHDIDAFELSRGGGDADYKCPACSTKLRYHLTFFGEQGFTITAGQGVITIDTNKAIR